MSDYSTRATVKLEVNGQAAKNMLSELDGKAKQLTEDLNKAKEAGNTIQMNKLQKELDKVNREIKNVESSTERANKVLGSLDKASPKELKATLAQLKKELNHLERGSDAWNKHQEAIRGVKAELGRINDEQKVGLSWAERMNATFAKWQTTILAAGASMTAFIMAGRKAVQAYAEMDDELATTTKYTGIAGDDLKVFSEELDKIATRTSKIDLLKLAEEAGRLGKNSVGDVLGYVKAADQLNIALEDLGQGATETMAKMAGMFGLEDQYGTEEALLKVGSTINELSQNCAASKPYIAEFTSKLSGAGMQAGMTVQEIMAFGSVLDVNNQKMEASATALQKLMTDAYKTPEKFASALGVTLEEFNSKMSNATEGMLWMFEEMNKKGGLDKLAPMLGEMGENGTRTTAVFASLAKNTDLVRKQIIAANKAFEEGTSCTREYNIMNNTYQGQLEQAKKRTQAMAVELGEHLAPVMRLVHSGTYYLLQLIKTLVDFFVKYKGVIITMTAAYVAYKVAVALSTTTIKAQVIWEKVVLGLYKAKYAATLLLNTVTGLMTLNIKKAKEAWIAFSATLNASPIGLAATAITAVVVGLAAWAKGSSNVSKAEKERKKLLDEANKSAADQVAIIRSHLIMLQQENIAANVKKEILKKLKRETGNLNIELDRNNRLTAQSVANINAYIKAVQKKAVVEAFEKRMGELAVMEADLEASINKQKRKLKEYDDRVVGYGNQIGGALLAQGAGQYRDALTASLERDRNALADIRRQKSALQVDLAKAYNGLSSLTANLGTEDDNDIVIPSAVPGYTYTPSGGGGGGSGGGSGSGGGDGSENHEPTYLEKATAAHEQAVLRLQIAYMTGKKNYDQYVTEMMAEDKKYYDDVTTNQQVSEDDRLKLQKDYLEKQETYAKNARTRNLDEIERDYAEQQMKARQNYVDGVTTKGQFDETMNQLELDNLNKKRTFYQQQVDALKASGDVQSETYIEMNEKLVDANNTYMSKVISDREEKLRKQQELTNQAQQEEQNQLREHQRTLEDIRNEYFGMNKVRAKQEYDASMEALEEVYNAELKMVGDNEAEKLRIKEAYEKAKLALAKKYNQMEEEDNRNFLQKWNDDVIEFLNSDLGKAITQGTQQIASSMESIFTQVSSLISAEAEIAENKISSQYDAQISLAEGNKQKTEKLEKEKQAKIAKIKNEAEQKKFKMQVISTVAQTAISAVNAYSSAAAVPLIGYILAPIAATAAIAAGMLQVAALKKQAQASASQGYAEGGYTRPGGKYQVAGVVHAGEWVASQELLNHPTAAGIIHMLDEAQRRHSLGSLSSRDVSRSITAPHELAMLGDGGMSDSLALQAVAMAKYAMVIDRLNERLDEPFVTVNTVAGDNGIEQAQQRYNRIMRNKSR